MKTFYQFTENDIYRPSIDGPALEPTTIAGAEHQIQSLATQIRTTFGIDPSFKEFNQQIQQATKLLEQAANLLGNNMSGEQRATPHKWQLK
jgi:hypothetical protein